MNEWIYVAELVPHRRVKVGRTGRLPQRLAAHLSAADMSGCAVARIAAFAVVDAVQAERDLISAIVGRSGALLVHGRETFADVPFTVTADLANAIATAQHTAARQCNEDGAERISADLLNACLQAMDTAGVAQISLDHLRRSLGEVAPTSNADLGRLLRALGVKPEAVHCPREGRTMRGVKRKWLLTTSSRPLADVPPPAETPPGQAPLGANEVLAFPQVNGSIAR